MNSSSFTHLLFDLDGTLTDPKVGLIGSIQQALQKMDYPVPDSKSLEWCIGPPLHELFSVLLTSKDDELIKQAITLFRERYSTVGKYECRVYPDVPEMLSYLRRRDYRIFLATTKPTVYARDILDHFGLLAYFDAVYGSELDGRLTDKGELIHLILNQEAVPPGQAMMIGDRSRDTEGARQNGIVAGGVTYGYGSVEELETARAAILFHSPAEIITFLRKARRWRMSAQSESGSHAEPTG